MKRRLCAVLCAATVLLTGCGGIELTETENDVIAEYAATLLLKYSNSYQSKLQEEVFETEPETTVFIPPLPTDSSSVQNEQNNSASAETTTVSEKSLSEALGIAVEGFQAEYTGYEIVDSYPNTSDAYFVMTATKNNSLLILKFNLTNTSTEEKECDILSKQLNYRCQINGDERFGSQLTMLLDDLSSYKEVLMPEETKQAVLIFQIPSEYQENMEKMSFIIRDKEESYTYQYK